MKPTRELLAYLLHRGYQRSSDRVEFLDDNTAIIWNSKTRPKKAEPSQPTRKRASAPRRQLKLSQLTDAERDSLFGE